MKITNLLGLPQPLVDAVTNDPYTGGVGADISVTRLIQPPRKVALEKLHREEMVEDAADRIYALCGQIGHLILERAALRNIVEHRFYTQVGGWTISGQCDIMTDNPFTLLDYKFTSSYTVKGGIKDEWIQQLNLLAMLSRANGYDVTAAQIVCIFRDWSVMEAKRDSSYPQKQVLLFKIPLWTNEAASNYAFTRVRMHQQAQEGQLPECTAEERWSRPPKWAVMKPGRKRAVKLHDNPDDAEAHAFELGKGHYAETRPVQQTRCMSYCAASPFCEQWKKLSAALDTTAEEEEPA